MTKRQKYLSVAQCYLHNFIMTPVSQSIPFGVTIHRSSTRSGWFGHGWTTFFLALYKSYGAVQLGRTSCTGVAPGIPRQGAKVRRQEGLNLSILSLECISFLNSINSFPEGGLAFPDGEAVAPLPPLQLYTSN